MPETKKASRRRVIGMTALGVGSVPIIGAAFAANPSRESAGSVVPRSGEPRPGRDLISLEQFPGRDDQKLIAAIAEAGEARDGALGHTVKIPRGVIEFSRPFNIENRVTIEGVNKRGSVIRAAGGHRGPYMATVVNGRLSSFDNSLSHLTLDCNDVPGLGGIDAQAWQEGGGLRNVLISKFRTVGVLFRDGFGGASTCLIRESEIFGSAVASADAGVRVEQISAAGGFLLQIADTTITGSPGAPMAYGVDVINDSLLCQSVHFEEVRRGIHLNGVGNHVLIGTTGAVTVETLIEIHEDFAGSLIVIGCSRTGATNFIKDNRKGGFGTIQYDVPFFRIESQPAIALGANVAGGNFNGALPEPNVDKSFGISSITKSGAGNYTILLNRPGIDANSFAVLASTNTSGGTVTCSLNGSASVKVVNRDPAGAPADANEIKFLVTRVA